MRALIRGAPLPPGMLARCDGHPVEIPTRRRSTFVVWRVKHPGVAIEWTAISDLESSLQAIRHEAATRPSVFGSDSLPWRRVLLAYAQQFVHELDLGVEPDDLVDAAEAGLGTAHDWLRGREGEELSAIEAIELAETLKWARTALLESERTRVGSVAPYKEGAKARVKQRELDDFAGPFPLFVCLRCRRIVRDRSDAGAGGRQWFRYCSDCGNDKNTASRRPRRTSR